MKPKAITVLSGGLDSTVATSTLIKEYQIQALTFNYGQRSAHKEIESSQAICQKLNIPHKVLELDWLAELGGSALTTNQEVPQLQMDQLDDSDICGETARKVWVPGRNIVFTAIATSFAEASHAQAIIVGWDQEEAATFPDNSIEFLESFNQLLDLGSPDDIQIQAPLINMDKKNIVKMGFEVGAPLELSYSCYMGGEIHCGECESCMRRKRAFQEANLADPTIYEV